MIADGTGTFGKPLSQIVEVSPSPGAVEAMQAAIIQWHYEEPKSARA